MNLDAKINEIGFEIANIIDENLINKILVVLANDGVYAMWVYCLNKLEWKFYNCKNNFENTQLVKFIKELNKLPFKKILSDENINKLCDLTKKIEELQDKIKNEKDKNKKKELQKEKNNKEVERQKILNSFFQSLSNDLNQLLFFKELVEKVLIYARYHSKALKDE